MGLFGFFAKNRKLNVATRVFAEVFEQSIQTAGALFKVVIKTAILHQTSQGSLVVANLIHEEGGGLKGRFGLQDRLLELQSGQCIRKLLQILQGFAQHRLILAEFSGDTAEILQGLANRPSAFLNHKA